MTRTHFLISTILIGLMVAVQTGEAQTSPFTEPEGEVKSNPNAPAGYDAKLQPNDMAIGVDGLYRAKAVRIISRSGGRYKAVTIDHPNHTYWYNSNSVYPYYDQDEFTSIKFGNSKYLAPYLECYAKKHSLDLDKIKGGILIPRYGNAREMKQDLQAEHSNLAEIETLLKSKLKARPNTFLSYSDNPAIWEEISTKRAEYLQCAVGEKTANAATESGWLRAHLELIQKMQKEVDEYMPGRSYFVSTSSTNYLLFAFSAKELARWLQESDAPEFEPSLKPILDALAASAAQKLPQYNGDPADYRFRDPAAERVLMGYFKAPATIKVHRIGVGDSGWQVQKDKYDLLPSYRYKFASVLYRDSADEHPYCRVATVRVKQDYAGGGRYNAVIYRSSATESLAGCPASR